MARASCLYCGAALPPEAVPSAEAPRAALEPAPSERELVVLLLDGAPAEALARLLGLSPFEAGQRARRGGAQLHRIASREEAAVEAERLQEGGLRVMCVPEAEVRLSAQPLRARAGAWEEEALRLTLESGERRQLRAGELLLVVRGTIARAQEPPARARIRLAAPQEGHRIHLHLRAEDRPLELDPEAFEFSGAPSGGSSLVRLLGWARALAGSATVDEGFARLTPALAPALEAPEGVAGMARALAGPRPGGKPRPPLLDNLAQFRFYSAWRAAVERRRTPAGR